MLDRLLNASSGSGRLDKDFKVTALWLLPIAPGMVLLGFGLGMINPDVIWVFVGVGGLLLCMGLGFLLASKIAARWYETESNEPNS